MWTSGWNGGYLWVTLFFLFLCVAMALVLVSPTPILSFPPRSPLSVFILLIFFCKHLMPTVSTPTVKVLFLTWWELSQRERCFPLNPSFLNLPTKFIVLFFFFNDFNHLHPFQTFLFPILLIWVPMWPKQDTRAKPLKKFYTRLTQWLQKYSIKVMWTALEIPALCNY